MDDEVFQLHHLARVDLAGLAQLLLAVHVDHARRHDGLARAAAVAQADQLAQLIEFHVLAVQVEIDVWHGDVLTQSSVSSKALSGSAKNTKNGAPASCQ